MSETTIDMPKAATGILIICASRRRWFSNDYMRSISFEVMLKVSRLQA
jgi:hypothetical protein